MAFRPATGIGVEHSQPHVYLFVPTTGGSQRFFLLLLKQLQGPLHIFTYDSLDFVGVAQQQSVEMCASSIAKTNFLETKDGIPDHVQWPTDDTLLSRSSTAPATSLGRHILPAAKKTTSTPNSKQTVNMIHPATRVEPSSSLGAMDARAHHYAMG